MNSPLGKGGRILHDSFEKVDAKKRRRLSAPPDKCEKRMRFGKCVFRYNSKRPRAVRADGDNAPRSAIVVMPDCAADPRALDPAKTLNALPGAVRRKHSWCSRSPEEEHCVPAVLARSRRDDARFLKQSNLPPCWLAKEPNEPPLWYHGPSGVLPTATLPFLEYHTMRERSSLMQNESLQHHRLETHILFLPCASGPLLLQQFPNLPRSVFSS